MNTAKVITQLYNPVSFNNRTTISVPTIQMLLTDEQRSEEEQWSREGFLRKREI